MHKRSRLRWKGWHVASQLLEAKTPAVPIPLALSPRVKAMLAVRGIAATGVELIAWITGHEATWPVMALAPETAEVKNGNGWKSHLRPA